MLSKYPKLISSIIAGAIGIGGTTAITTDALDGFKPHSHEGLADINHNHADAQVSYSEGIEATIDGVLHECRVK